MRGSYGAWRRVVEPAAVIEVDDAKAHLRVSGDDEDALIESYIAAAVGWVEEFTGRALAPQTWELHLSRWPPTRDLDLPRPPLQSVTSVSYYDEAGSSYTLPATDYVLDVASEPGRLLLKRDSFWPSGVELRPGSGVVVRFVAGYAEIVPEPIVQAVRLLVGHYYENRESVVVGNVQAVRVPETVYSLLWPWRAWS